LIIEEFLKMKKQIVQTMIIIAGLMISPNISRATVVGSPHDFTASGGGTFVDTGGSDQVCVYCHTPHGAASSDRLGNQFPLWNRTTKEYASNYFTMYNSPTFNATYEDNKPTGTSLLCLSCHDGVSSLDSVLNQPYGYTVDFNVKTLGGFGNPANIGKDLSNDHPVSFEYTTALVDLDCKLQAPTSIDARLKLRNNRLECSTCHDAHEYGMDPEGILPDTTPFLRMSNAGSAMCRSCHLI
jgi:hypothetical protein